MKIDNGICISYKLYKDNRIVVFLPNPAIPHFAKRSIAFDDVFSLFLWVIYCYSHLDFSAPQIVESLHSHDESIPCLECYPLALILSFQGHLKHMFYKGNKDFGCLTRGYKITMQNEAIDK